MNRFILIVLVLAWVGGGAFGQSHDVLKLKNGSVIKGKIIPPTADQAAQSQLDDVAIETYDGSVWVFKTAEVAERSREPFKDPAIRYRSRGFEHYTELGPLAMSNRASNGITTSAFSFQTTNGYRFGQWLFAGIGVGADLYAVQTFVPIVLSIRGDFTNKGTKIPFYFVEGGHSINATSNDVLNINYRGGPTFAVGGGLKLLFHQSTAFIVGVGYRFQRATTERLDLPTVVEDFNRLTLRIGFSF